MCKKLSIISSNNIMNGIPGFGKPVPDTPNLQNDILNTNTLSLNHKTDGARNHLLPRRGVTSGWGDPQIRYLGVMYESNKEMP